MNLIPTLNRNPISDQSFIKCIDYRQEILKSVQSKKLILMPLIELRDYQLEVLYAFFIQRIRNIFLVWHRRCGKDIITFILLVLSAIEDPGLYHYIFPEIGQGERAIFQGMTKDGVSYLDLIPPELVYKPNYAKHFIEFKNGSILHLCGSDQPDKYRGGSSKGMGLSELAYHKPDSISAFLPMIRETKGFLIGNTTPQAHNHAYRLWETVKNDNSWFTSFLTVTDTKKYKIITDDQIREDMKIMSYEKIMQEYWCDFDVALESSYFSKYIKRAENNGRIIDFPIDTNLPVHTLWDLGVSDMTSICFVQLNPNGYYDYIHYYEQNNVGYEGHKDYLDMFKKKTGITYGLNFCPHDILQREQSDVETRKKKLEKLIGPIINVKAPKVKMDAIESSRAHFSKYRIHLKECRYLLDCLMNYQAKKLNTGVTVGPKHDWSSHGVDAFMLLGLAIDQGLLQENISMSSHTNEYMKEYIL
jgi:hypothetical protein